MIEEEQNRSQRIVKNTFFLYIRMFFVLAIGLYTSRVILKVLGETDFGIYSLVGGVITMFVFINQSLNAATQRFITFDLGLGDKIKLRDTFSMSINVYLFFSLFLVIVLESLGFYLLNQLNIDSTRMEAAQWVYQAMIVTTVINMLGIPYRSLISAHERMSFSAMVGVFDSVLKLGIVFIVSLQGFDKLKLYSILLIGVSLTNYLLNRLYCLKYFAQESSYKFVWDKNKFKHFLKFSGMSLYEQLAVMLTYQGIDIMLNMFFGVIVNAAMGITKQVQAALMNFISSFQGAMSPQITKSYASKDYQYLDKLMVVAPKFSLYLILIMVFPLYFNIEPILIFWLDNPPEYSVEFSKLILISSVLESISLPLRTLIFAQGNITRYQLVIGSILLLNLIFSFIFLKAGFSPVSVLWVRLIVYFLIDLIRIWFIKGLIKIPLIRYINKTFTPVLLVIVGGVLFNYIIHEWFSLNVPLNLFISVLIVGLLIISLGLDAFEKIYIRNYLNKKFRKK